MGLLNQTVAKGPFCLMWNSLRLLMIKGYLAFLNKGFKFFQGSVRYFQKFVQPKIKMQKISSVTLVAVYRWDKKSEPNSLKIFKQSIVYKDHKQLKRDEEKKARFKELRQLMNEIKGTQYDEAEKVIIRQNFSDFAFKHKGQNDEIKYGVITKENGYPVKLSSKKTSKNMFKNNDPHLEKEIQMVRDFWLKY